MPREKCTQYFPSKTALNAFDRVTPLFNIVDEREKIMQLLDKTQVETTEILSKAASEAAFAAKPYEQEVLKAATELAASASKYVSVLQNEIEKTIPVLAEQSSSLLLKTAETVNTLTSRIKPLGEESKKVVSLFNSQLVLPLSTVINSLTKMIVIMFNQETAFLKSVPTVTSDSFNLWIQEPITLINLFVGVAILTNLVELASDEVVTDPLETERLVGEVAQLSSKLLLKDEELTSAQSLLLSVEQNSANDSKAAAAAIETVKAEMEKKNNEESMRHLKISQDYEKRESQARVREEEARDAVKHFLIEEGYLVEGGRSEFTAEEIPMVLKDCAGGSDRKAVKETAAATSVQVVSLLSSLGSFLFEQGYASSESVAGLNLEAVPSFLMECGDRMRGIKEGQALKQEEAARSKPSPDAEAYMSEILAENEELKQQLLGKDERLWGGQKEPNRKSRFLYIYPSGFVHILLHSYSSRRGTHCK